MLEEDFFLLPSFELQNSLFSTLHRVGLWFKLWTFWKWCVLWFVRLELVDEKQFLNSSMNTIHFMKVIVLWLEHKILFNYFYWHIMNIPLMGRFFEFVCLFNMIFCEVFSRIWLDFIHLNGKKNTLNRKSISWRWIEILKANSKYLINNNMQYASEYVSKIPNQCICYICLRYTEIWSMNSF